MLRHERRLLKRQDASPEISIWFLENQLQQPINSSCNR
eukprot:SAG11_NODE_26174_length_348_cov_3.871486_1_plen_37_part_10